MTQPLKTPSATDSLMTWLNYWAQLHVSAIDLGLERVRPVAECLAVCQPTAPVIMVAGTNGKGSTTTAIAAMYSAAGYRVGLYQSPHVFRFNERIKLNGQEVSDAVLVAAFVAVEHARQQCQLSLSFFEATTLAAFVIFQQQDCDVWVLEVGLGGRLDVVNLIDADVAVITNIGLDHTDWLGDSIEQIAFEKAGIVRANIPVIFAGEQPLPQAIQDKISESAAQLYRVGQDYFYQSLPQRLIANHSQDHQKDQQQDHQKDHPQDQQQWQFACAGHTLNFAVPSLAISNCATALAAVMLGPLPVNYAAMQQGLQRAQLAGRFERRCIAGKTVIFDAGHNPHGMQFLTQQLRQFLAYNSHVKAVTAVFSMLVDKDIEQVVEILKPAIKNWHVAPLDVARAAPMSRLNRALQDQQLQAYANVAQAFASAIAQASPEDVILVCGSFHTLEAVWEYLQDEHE